VRRAFVAAVMNLQGFTAVVSLWFGRNKRETSSAINNAMGTPAMTEQKEK
jgi:hypothetical protein